MRIKRVPNLDPDFTYIPDFGQLVRKARTECGLYQSDLAALVGINPATLSYYENGNRRVPAEVLYKVGVVCNTSFKLGLEDSHG